VASVARQIVDLPYHPRDLQREVHAELERKRFGVLVCHRRFGKTVLAINELIKQVVSCTRERPRVAYVAPLYRQAKAVAWDYVKHYCRPIPGVTFNEAELRADLPGGRRLQLFGSDNADTLRGIYLDAVVLDEYALMAPRVWSEVLRPALSDRGGTALFIGTPLGSNHFKELYDWGATQPDWVVRTYRASETGILPPEELAAAQAAMSEDHYAQEFECSWTAAIQGAYYGRLVEAAERDGRVTRVPYDPALPVETWWDLGIGDATAIWFAQRLRSGEVHLIDYYEASGEALAHYVQQIQSRPWVWGDHVLPHDVRARALQTGRTTEEAFRELGLKPVVQAAHKIEAGIEAVRVLLPRCWFDAERCRRGLDCLRQYRKTWDDARQIFADRPLHDFTSHGSDAFRYGAMHAPRRGWEPIVYDNRGII
jgi:hypothetical protein